MAYATLELFRRMTHFSTSDISDTDIGNMISDADKALIRLTTSEVYLEELEGNIDGTNVDFRTKHFPIADADADGSVDGDDVTIYYSNFDSVTGWRELGSSQSVSSIQKETGIITMTTAPTSSTAEAGVFAVYRYDSLGVSDSDVLALAATYYLAHLVAMKLKGETPQYNMTSNEAAYLRKDLIGPDWLTLCYETLGLQDKIFITRSDGDGIPEPNSSQINSGIKNL